MTRPMERRTQRVRGITSGLLAQSKWIIWCLDPENVPAMIDLLIAQGSLSEADRPRCVHWRALDAAHPRGTGPGPHRMNRNQLALTADENAGADQAPLQEAVTGFQAAREAGAGGAAHARMGGRFSVRPRRRNQRRHGLA